MKSESYKGNIQQGSIIMLYVISVEENVGQRKRVIGTLIIRLKQIDLCKSNLNSDLFLRMCIRQKAKLFRLGVIKDVA